MSGPSRYGTTSSVPRDNRSDAPTTLPNKRQLRAIKPRCCHTGRAIATTAGPSSHTRGYVSALNASRAWPVSTTSSATMMVDQSTGLSHETLRRKYSARQAKKIASVAAIQAALGIAATSGPITGASGARPSP